jgi:hypothetical protein
MAKPRAPFSVEYKHSEGTLVARVHGYVDTAQGTGFLERVVHEVKSAPRGLVLIYDASAVEGFETALVKPARANLAQIRDHVAGIAVVSTIATVRFTLSTLQLLSDVPLTSFTTLTDALAWARALPGARR